MIKKRVVALAMCILMIFPVVATSLANTVVDEPSLRVIINGATVVFPDAQPFIDENGRTQVPVRFVTEALNGTVSWDNDSKTATVYRGKISASLTIDKNEITVLDVTKTIDTAPRLVNERTHVPLRFISESFGAKIAWDEKTKTIDILDSGEDNYRVRDFVIDIGDGDQVEDASVIGGMLSFIKASGLNIIEGAAEQDKTRPLLTMHISIEDDNSDTSEQRKEVEEILKQKFSPKFVSDVMYYASKKRNVEDVLPITTFRERGYRVYVSCRTRHDPLAITIYLDCESC